MEYVQSERSLIPDIETVNTSNSDTRANVTIEATKRHLANYVEHDRRPSVISQSWDREFKISWTAFCSSDRWIENLSKQLCNPSANSQAETPIAVNETTCRSDTRRRC